MQESLYCTCINNKKLEKTEGAIKNRQSRDTGCIGHKTQNEDKQNQNHHREKINTTDSEKIHVQTKQKNTTEKRIAPPIQIRST